MKKFFVACIIFFVLLISFSSMAQLPISNLYIHGLVAAPLDKSSRDLYTVGIGSTAGILAGKKTTKFNASVGYMYFFADDANNPAGNQTYIPFKAGIRQYIPLSLHSIFIQGNGGLGFVGYKNDKKNDARFAFDFGAGIKLTSFEAALIWENFKEKDPSGWASWITLQAGFNIGL